jgi:hypothetical protein
MIRPARLTLAEVPLADLSVERAVTIHVEQTILPARTDDQGTAS